MEQPNWQPISFLPQISLMINGMLEAAIDTCEPLKKIKVHDDYTIKRIFEVTGSQVEDEWLYDEQLKRWLDIKNLSTELQTKIKDLQGKMAELKQVNRKNIEIAKANEDKTIDKIMSKSDAEVCLDLLLEKF